MPGCYDVRIAAWHFAERHFAEMTVGRNDKLIQKCFWVWHYVEIFLFTEFFQSCQKIGYCLTVCEKTFLLGHVHVILYMIHKDKKMPVYTQKEYFIW